MGNICPLLVGIKTCITVMEINMDVPGFVDSSWRPYPFWGVDMVGCIEVGRTGEAGHSSYQVVGVGGDAQVRLGGSAAPCIQGELVV